MRQVTLYLTTNIGPGGKDWVKGLLLNHTALGVTICQDINRQEETFYPTHQIQRMEFRS